MKDLENKQTPVSLILDVECPRDSIVAGGFVAVNNDNATLVITHTTAVMN